MGGAPIVGGVACGAGCALRFGVGAVSVALRMASGARGAACGLAEPRCYA